MEEAAMRLKTSSVLMSAALLLLCGLGSGARADVIPYPAANVGNINTDVYTFTATTTGPITAYFGGASADNVSELGMLVNGVSTNLFGLNNSTAQPGDSVFLGNVTVGDTLIFVLHTLQPSLG